MDLKHYYSKVREVEATIAGEFTVIVSHETADGGKEGTPTEVTRRVAATMVVGGFARLATGEEQDAFHAAQGEAKRMVEQVAAASRVQFAVLSTAELDKMRGGKSKA